MNRYTLMVERQKKELYELLGTMPAAYVYNESQLVEGLEKIGLKQIRRIRRAELETLEQ